LYKTSDYPYQHGAWTQRIQKCTGKSRNTSNRILPDQQKSG
jgi:hypothetical protein